MILDLTQLRLESMPFRVQTFIQQNLEDWVYSTVVDSCKSFAVAAGVSSRYIEAIKFRRLGPFVCEVYLDYQGPNGEPLGLWFEFGTNPHEIAAKYARFLYFFWDKLKKYVKFRKVKHPGTKGKYIMTRGAKFGIPRLMDKITMETEKFMKETRFA